MHKVLMIYAVDFVLYNSFQVYRGAKDCAGSISCLVWTEVSETFLAGYSLCDNDEVFACQMKGRSTQRVVMIWGNWEQRGEKARYLLFEWLHWTHTPSST
jgi:hypothetical protein